MSNLVVVAGAVVAVVLVVTGLVILVRAGNRRSRPAPVLEADPWEAALLAAPTLPAEPGQVLRREALLERPRDFDPTAWDDRPDGVEGTDLGLIGGSGDRP